jgi:hypothetical protein
VNRNSLRFFAKQLAFTSVQSDADGYSQLLDRFTDGAGTPDPPSRSVKSGQESIAGVVDFLAVEVDQLPSDN